MTEAEQLALPLQLNDIMEHGPEVESADDLLDIPLVREVLGDSYVASLRSTFAAMTIAEEEIARGQEKYPHYEGMIRDTFGAIRPLAGRTPSGETMLSLADQVYRGYCRELIDRAAAQWNGRKKVIDLSQGTSAEICIGLMEASFVAPLSRIAASIYLRNFVKLFGFNPVAGEDLGWQEWLTKEPGNTTVEEWVPFETWKGEALEEEARARHKIRQEWRKMTFDQASGRWQTPY